MRTIDTNKTKHNIAEVPYEKRTNASARYSLDVLQVVEELGSKEDYLDARVYAYDHGFAEENY